MNENAKVNARQLRSFGLIFAALVLVLFAGLIPWLTEKPLPRWPFWLATPVATLALLWPRGLKPLYTVWMKFGDIMGRVNTVLILSILFYAMVTPTGWLMRLMGKDPMRRELDDAATTYRVVSEAHGREDMEKPY